MNFIDKIRSLGIKSNYTKSDLLVEHYLVGEEKNLKIYYAPFDYINKAAKIIIVGITPGWSQMEKSFKSAATALFENESWENSLKEVKKKASFAGTMRNNLISMLDELGLNKKLQISSSSQLFEEYNELLHSTSFLKYPVFSTGKNYTGNNPKPFDSELMTNFIRTEFVNELNSFENKLIIPLGKSVSRVVARLSDEQLLNQNIFLENFPHPSGANGHRKKQFEENKVMLTNKINNWVI